MRTVLVMGASRGIGLEFVRQYAADGDRVIATARDAAGREHIEALGAQCLTLDVADPASVSGLAWQLDGEKIDVALYVAGVIDRASPLTPPSQAEFDRIMHVNVMGAMMAIPQVAPLVEEAGGCMAFISSRMASLGLLDASGSWLYRASKAALNMVVRTAQLDYPRATLMALSPGWVRTDMGGTQANLTASESVQGMRRVMGKLEARHRGAFFNHDGQPLPW
ncbi:MAG: SDR family oxidoreductase [Pseudomonadota bacterium]